MAKTDATAFDPASNIRDVSVSKNMLSIGPADFIQEVIIPMLDALEDLTEIYPVSPAEEKWDLEIKNALSNNLVYAKTTALSGLIGIIFFIGGWGATKTLDEIYETTIKDKVNNSLQGFLKSNASGRKVCASLLVNVKPKRISIIVATVGKDINEIKHSQSQVSPLLARAIDTAEKIATPGTVHLYIIEAGNINHDPLIYGSITEAIERVMN